MRSVALFALAGPLTFTIYQHGEFTPRDVEMTGHAVRAFSLALLGWSLIKLLATGYYARQNTKEPVRIAVWSLGLTMGLNVLVVAGLALTGQLHSQGGVHALLALTNGVGAVFNAWWLYRGLIREQVLSRGQALGGMSSKILAASALMAAFLFWFGGVAEAWIELSVMRRVLWLGGLVIGGATVYFAALWAFGARAHQFRLQPPTGRL